MSDHKTIKLGDREFSVPRLPIRVNRIVYPICRKLVQAELIERCIAEQGQLAATDEEMDDLIKLLWESAHCAEPTLDRTEFDTLPITPPQILEAFFNIRYQTGAWIPADSAPGEAPEGEHQGA